MASANANSGYTGRKRRRTTSPLVRASDIIARTLITMGGIGTILAVSLVCVFLIYVVVPLFSDPTVDDSTSIARAADRQPIHVEVDEHQLIGVSIYEDGTAVVIDLADGLPIHEFKIGEGKPVTAWAFPLGSPDFAIGFDDGTIQLGTLRFRTQFLSDEEVGPEMADVELGAATPFREGMAVRISDEQFRYSTLEHTMQEPIAAESPSPVVLLDLAILNSGPVYAALTEDGVLRLRSVRSTKNLLTGEVTSRVSGTELPYQAVEGRRPDYLCLAGLGDNVFVAWKDGFLQRFDARDYNQTQLAEEVDLLPEEGLELTSLEFLLGRVTLMAGDSTGRLKSWFRIKPDDAPTPDGAILVSAHEIQGPNSPVTAIRASLRSRMVAAGFADGTARLYHVTTDSLLLELSASTEDPVTALVISPKDDGIVAAQKDAITMWHLDPKHPEATVQAIFGKVWYEGYPGPEFVWQSSSGNDNFEPKFGLVPLIFGTLKATLYSMLFGLPLAIAAAIYTSEFLNVSIRSKIKPTIELMASLPSVVLGFLAALVFAPFVETVLPTTIAAFFTIPFAFLVAAYIWQLVPYQVSLKLNRYRFAFIVATIPFGLLAAWVIGPLVENLLFGGDLRRWLDGQIGSGLGGWMILLIPLSGIVVAVLLGRFVNPILRFRSAEWPRQKLALIDASKFVLAALGTLGLAALTGLLLTQAGFDPRGNNFFPPDVMSTYVQRNAMVVGFVMGFAVIPIIYTIAEDALSSVPEHLRAGSLGAGATQWQTATRIIIPTAMSGLFSATMIGLGRAVGETMIVLMAAGNTPVMDWNIFNGFRTLSANIAVELPEAPINGTHYRMLFLAALSLFAMTFFVNTIAEVIRLRFRKRAFQL